MMKAKFPGLLLLLLAALFFTCKKNDITRTDQTEVPDFQNRVTYSASGFVTDENNAAVEGATVKMGTSTTLTDEFGYFSFTDVQVVKNAGVITVKRNGYFNGIRTVTAEEGKPAFVRIKLSPKTIIGNIDAAAGGIVAGTNGLSVSLPPQGVVEAGSGATYTGPVNVFARWLDPSSSDILNTMPG
ncbi:MAG: carboxypeptidase regulatory-like domain-containing protein, partial [Sphingobacteriales bacterium]